MVEVSAWMRISQSIRRTWLLFYDFNHDNVIKWKHFPRYWPFVQGIHRAPVNSPHKGQWRGTLMFSLICPWMNDWVNNREADDLRRHLAHHDVIVMCWFSSVMPYECIRLSEVRISPCTPSRHDLRPHKWCSLYPSTSPMYRPPRAEPGCATLRKTKHVHNEIITRKCITQWKYQSPALLAYLWEESAGYWRDPHKKQYRALIFSLLLVWKKKHSIYRWFEMLWCPCEVL